MDMGQELNACAECGFTSRDWAQFARHVERHESGGGAGGISSRKNSFKVPTTPAGGAPDSDSVGTIMADDGGTDFQHLLDLALPKIEDDLDNAAAMTPNCSMEDDEEMIIGRLADLSRFLNANHHHHQSNRAGNSASPPLVEEGVLSPCEKRRRRRSTTTNTANAGGEEEEEEEDAEKTDDKNDGSEQSPRRQKTTKSRSKPNGGGTGGGGGNKTTHKCPHCTFTTYMSQHMKSHLRAHENFIGQMYVCDVCGMAFSQKANMHRHRGTHSGVKPYECRFCKKRFFRKDQMQEHSMTHIKTGDDFDCPVAGCECKFSQHSLLRQHLDERHAISAAQQAHCKRCTLQFANSRRLLLHYQTKHDEYYNAVSPVPDGHSPVKRLVMNNNNNSSKSEAARPGSSSSAPMTTISVASSSSATTAATAHAAKRKSRKRARRQRSNSGGGGGAVGGSRRPITDDATALYSPKMLTADKQIARAAATATNSAQSQQQQLQQQQTSVVSGYNVEELLRLNCAGANANKNCHNNNAMMTNAAASQQALFKMPSQCSAVGFEQLFREHLLRNSTSIFAHQFGAGGATVVPSSSADASSSSFPPAFPTMAEAPLPQKGAQNHHQQQVSAAAAAHLFMQSLLMPSQQPPPPPALSTNCAAAAGGRHQHHQGMPNPPMKEEDDEVPGPNISPKHLPLAKSPDCRGLVLNGFHAREGIDYYEHKLLTKQQQQQLLGRPTTAGATTNSSSTPPMIITSSDCGTKMLMNGHNLEEEGSESEAGGASTCFSSKQQVGDMELAFQTSQDASSRERPTSSAAIAPAKVPSKVSSSSRLRHGTNSSAHSSTTHSPSSSSSTSSSSSSSSTVSGGTSSATHVVMNGAGGGESTASSSGGGGAAAIDSAGGDGCASVSVESSPLKDLNNKLLSRALLNASGGSSSSASGAAADGLLLKGLLLVEPSSSMVAAGDMDCALCGLMFTDQTLYLLHKGLHSEADPWRCNLCGQSCSDKYTFTTHMISSDHS